MKANVGLLTLDVLWPRSDLAYIEAFLWQKVPVTNTDMSLFTARRIGKCD